MLCAVIVSPLKNLRLIITKENDQEREKPGETGLARVVEEGEGGKDGGSDQTRLCSVLEPPPQHLELGHLVRVELQQLKEVEEESGNEKLFSSQL